MKHKRSVFENIRLRRCTRGVTLLGFVYFTASSAVAFDSRCRDASGKDCVPGPAAARQRWNAHDSEHLHLWDASVQTLSLPSHLTGLVQLRVGTVEKSSGSFSTLQPQPFTEVNKLVDREYSIGEMAQLPDLAYSLSDWALGNEYCPLSSLFSPETCHGIPSHMGPVNSSHFLPQAEGFYRHYHKLAMARAETCKGMRDSLGSVYPEFVQACDQQAFTFEAIGQHYLQDAWSIGHMWPRWGGAEPADFGSSEWRERALLIALTSGLIHGAKGVLQDALGLGEISIAGVTGEAIIWDDAMCAPVDPKSSSCLVADLCLVLPSFWKTLTPPSYIDGVDHQVREDVGDVFEPQLQTDAKYSAPYQRMLSCARGSLIELADAAGTPHSAGGSSLRPSNANFSTQCFAQRVTDGTMWLGAGIDVRLLGVTVPIPGLFSVKGALATRVPFAPILAAHSNPVLNWVREKTGVGGLEASLAEIVISFSEKKGGTVISEDMRAQFRHDVAGLATIFDAAARTNPNGSYLVNSLPSILGIGSNDTATFQHDPPAFYVDPEPPYEVSAKLPASMQTDADRADALARTYHRAFSVEWCDKLTTEDLEALKKRAKQQGSGPACEVCAEFAARHLRFGASASNYDAKHEPLCSFLGSSDFVYQASTTANPDREKLALVWCGCETEEKPEQTCSGQFAGSIIDASTRQPVSAAQVTYRSAKDQGVVDVSNGEFTSGEVPCGALSLDVEASGYLPASLTATIKEDQVKQLIELHAVDADCIATPTEIVGWVRDAATGEFVQGAAVELREGPDASESSPVLDTVQTDNQGVYAFPNIKAGYYTVHVRRTGYEASSAHQVSACGKGNFESDINLVPTKERRLAFVLNWAEPNDLDLHLLLPNGDEVGLEPCQGSLTKAPYAQLDIDHRKADGPESISVGRIQPGVYTLYAHNFSAQNEGAHGFGGSQAELLVYEDSVLTERLVVPTGGNEFFWDILSFEGNDKEVAIHPLNTLTNRRSNPNNPEEFVGICTPR